MKCPVYVSCHFMYIYAHILGSLIHFFNPCLPDKSTKKKVFERGIILLFSVLSLCILIGVCFHQVVLEISKLLFILMKEVTQEMHDSPSNSTRGSI